MIRQILVWVVGVGLILGGGLWFFLAAGAAGMASRQTTLWENVGAPGIGLLIAAIGIGLLIWG